MTSYICIRISHCLLSEPILSHNQMQGADCSGITAGWCLLANVFGEAKDRGNDVSEPLSSFTVKVITDKPEWRNLILRF